MSKTFRHSDPAQKGFKGRSCELCGLPLEGFWQRKFCDNSCKQKAYRDRTRDRWTTPSRGAASKPRRAKKPLDVTRHDSEHIRKGPHS